MISEKNVPQKAKNAKRAAAFGHSSKLFQQIKQAPCISTTRPVSEHIAVFLPLHEMVQPHRLCAPPLIVKSNIAETSSRCLLRGNQAVQVCPELVADR